MTWTAVAIGGSALVGAYASDRAADKAAGAAKKGSQQSIAFQRESRDMARADQAPYRQAGYTALNALMALTGLPQPGGPSADAYGSSGGHPLFGNGDQPLTAEGISAVYRAVLGREPDQGGLKHYLTRGKKVGGEKGLAPFGHSGTEALDVLGLGGKDGKRQAWTLNDLLNDMLGSDEYNEKLRSGKIEAWTPEKRQALFQEGLPSSTTGGVGTFNATPEQMLMADPGYQIRKEEGMRALNASASAAGGVLSGGGIKKAIRYGQEYASNEYTNLYNRLSNIAGLGQTSAGYSSQAAMQFGAGAGAAAQNAAYTRGSAYIAQGNSFNNLLGSGVQALGYYNQNRALQPSGGNYTPYRRADADWDYNF